MASIPQVFTSNTFGQWVTSTQEVISRLNTLSEGGNGSTYYANTNVEIANNLIVRGNVTVSGNIILDEIGFDDLLVNGSATISNTLTVSGETTLNTAVIDSANITEASIIVIEDILTFNGPANTQIYNAINSSSNSIIDTALAFAIALG